MKKLLFVVKILFIVSLIIWIGFKFDLQTAREIIRSSKLSWAIAAIVISLIANTFVAERWKLIIRGILPGKKPSLWNLFWYNLLGAFYSICIPTSIAGEAARVYKLRNDLSADYVRSTLSVALDRLLGAGSWFLLFLIAPSPIHRKGYWFWLVLLVPIAVIIFRKRFVVNEQRLFDFSRHHPVDAFLAVMNSIIAQVLFIIVTYSVLQCFSLNIGIWQAAGLTATTTLAGIIPLSLFGIGLREGSLLALLPTYGASPTQGALITSTLILINYCLGLTGGIFELGRSGWSFSRFKSESVTVNHLDSSEIQP